MGPPGFSDISLPACHGLKTPTGLHVLAVHRTLSYCLRHSLKPRHPQLATDFEAVPALKGARTPLRPTGCSVYASPALFVPFNGNSAAGATLNTGGRLPLTRRGLTPRKICRALPGAKRVCRKTPFESVALFPAVLIFKSASGSSIPASVAIILSSSAYHKLASFPKDACPFLSGILPFL